MHRLLACNGHKLEKALWLVSTGRYEIRLIPSFFVSKASERQCAPSPLPRVHF